MEKEPNPLEQKVPLSEVEEARRQMAAEGQLLGPDGQPVTTKEQTQKLIKDAAVELPNDPNTLAHRVAVNEGKLAAERLYGYKG